MPERFAMDNEFEAFLRLRAELGRNPTQEEILERVERDFRELWRF